MENLLKWVTPLLIVFLTAGGGLFFWSVDGRFESIDDRFESLEAQMVRGDNLLRKEIGHLREEMRYIRERIDSALAERVASSNPQANPD